MIRKATSYVPFDDDRALLDGCGVARPAVSLGRYYHFDPELWMNTDPIGCAEGGNCFAYVGDDAVLLDPGAPTADLPDSELLGAELLDAELLTNRACDGPSWYAHCALDPCNTVDPTGLGVAEFLAARR